MNLGKKIPTDLRVPVALNQRSTGVSQSALNLWLVDDNREIRSLLANLIAREGSIECARQFSSAEALLEALQKETPPDAILLDLSLGGMSGIDALRPIRSLAASVHVFVMTTFYDGDVAARAFSLGASGFILKRQEIERTVECIRRVSAEAVPKSQWRASVRQTAVHWPWVAQVMHARPLLMRAIGVLRTFL
jgi:DNA-binding NarL/FixJ family response regulator